MHFIFMLKHFCVLIKPVALPAMGWACPYHLSSFDTRIFSKYRDTENVQFWGSQQNQSNCHMTSTILRNSCQNHLKSPIYSPANNTHIGGVLFFYKTWCRVLVSIRMLPWPSRIFESIFFQPIPALIGTSYSLTMIHVYLDWTFCSFDAICICLILFVWNCNCDLLNNASLQFASMQYSCIIKTSSITVKH